MPIAFVSAENRVMRRQTWDFINVKPLTVMLKRPKKISDGMGGFKKLSDETIPPQKMRLVTQTESVTVVSHTADGEEVNVDYVLIGMWDSNISNGDYFIMNGHKYEIVLVREDRSYETWAQVTDRG